MELICEVDADTHPRDLERFLKELATKLDEIEDEANRRLRPEWGHVYLREIRILRV